MRRYHHIGIPTTEAKPGETHLKYLKVFVVSHEKSEFGRRSAGLGRIAEPTVTLAAKRA